MGKDNSNLLLFGGIAALGLFAFASSDKGQILETPNQGGQGGTILAPKTPTEFIKKYYGYALQSEKLTGVPALVTLAQAGLESAWGKHAYGNNFFGIKAGSSWKGAIQKLKTWECGKTNDEIIQVFQPHSQGSNPSCNSANKPSYRVYGKFRAYPTPADGFADHGKFLKDNKRYANAFNFKNDAEKFAIQVAIAGEGFTISGYATAPNYGKVLVDTIKNIRKVMGTSTTSW